MRYVIMANGKGTRWKMFNGVPKHLIKVKGETLLQRTTRLAHETDPEAEVIISSSNPECVADGARRYEPVRNELEIDRFVPELVEDDMAFLYGDTFYTDDSFAKIVREPCSKLAFYGNEKSIVAVKVGDASLMRKYFDEVRQAYIEGRLDACKGWQLYHSYVNGEYGERISRIHQMAQDFFLINDATGDFNTPEDWLDFRAQENP